MIPKTHGNQRGTLELHEMMEVMAGWHWLSGPRAAILAQQGTEYLVHADGRRRSTDYRATWRHDYECASGEAEASEWRKTRLYDAATVANSVLEIHGAHCSVCRHHFFHSHVRFSDNEYRRVICALCTEVAEGALRNDKGALETLVDRPAIATEARAALRRIKAHGQLSYDAQRDLGKLERMVGFRQRKGAHA